jgi:CheY-like chemotaxis protein
VREFKQSVRFEPTVAGALQHRALVMLSPISTVLVVDDNPMARATAVRLFEDLGFKVVDAYNGVAALRLIERHPDIGLLFVDVRMPGMSGLELAEAALMARPHLKIVFTSGYVDRRDVPADAPFVPKPWRVDDVANAISLAGDQDE